MIEWADFIVFPFTTQPLVQEIYEMIRAEKPEVRIVYSVDFNFYELSKSHPYSDIFEEEMVISDVEDNMFFADMVLTGNIELSKYLVEKFNKLIPVKYAGLQSYMGIATIPTIIDVELVFKNVEYDIQKSVLINAKPAETIHTETVVKVIEKITDVAESVKEKDLIRKEEQAIDKEHIQTYSSDKDDEKKESTENTVNENNDNKGSEKISEPNTKTKKTSHGKSTAGAKDTSKSKSKPKRKRGRPKKEK